MRALGRLAPASPSGAQAYSPSPLRAQTEKKAERLVRRIIDHVVENGLASGAPLPPEAALAAQFDVGRPALREALQILEFLGVVEVRRGHRGGAVVMPASGRDYARMVMLFYRHAGSRAADVAAARDVVGPLLARLAAEQQSPQGMARLRELVVTLERGDKEEARKLSEARRQFHQVLASCSDNPVLNLFCSALGDLLPQRMTDYTLPESATAEAGRQFIAIGRAVLGGNGALAEKLMRAHLVQFRPYIWETRVARPDDRVSWT